MRFFGFSPLFELFSLGFPEANVLEIAVKMKVVFSCSFFKAVLSKQAQAVGLSDQG